MSHFYIFKLYFDIQRNGQWSNEILVASQEPLDIENVAFLTGIPKKRFMGPQHVEYIPESRFNAISNAGYRYTVRVPNGKDKTGKETIRRGRDQQNVRDLRITDDIFGRNGGIASR